MDLGFDHIALLGGEPSIREDIEEILGVIKGEKAPKSLMIITNGLVFNEKMYRSLFETDAVDARVVFSFDSFRSPNYKFQKPDLCLERIRAIQAMGMRYQSRERQRGVTVHTVISRENFTAVQSHVESFISMSIPVSLALVCPTVFVEEGRTAGYNEFTLEEIGMIVSQLESLDAKGHLNHSNQTLLEFLKRYPKGMLDITSECGAGRNSAIVNPDGEVFPCITSSYHGGASFGNIAGDGFKAACGRMRSHRCSSRQSQSCWDHFLWDRMARMAQGDLLG